MQKKAPVQFGLQSMQFGSIIYKGILYTKEGTTVSTTPDPGAGLGAAAGPPALVPCASQLFPFAFGFAVSAGKDTTTTERQM